MCAEWAATGNGVFESVSGRTKMDEQAIRRRLVVAWNLAKPSLGTTSTCCDFRNRPVYLAISSWEAGGAAEHCARPFDSMRRGALGAGKQGEDEDGCSFGWAQAATYKRVRGNSGRGGCRKRGLEVQFQIQVWW